jgi:beta-mannanase
MKKLFNLFLEKKRSAIPPVVLLTTVPLVAPITAAPAVVPEKTGHTVNFGVYDPEGHCLQDSAIAVEHMFISWATFQSGELLRQLDTIRSHGRGVFVTIEPWVDREITQLPSALLDDVTNGKYDRRIQQFAMEIAAFRDLVLLRWGHEMENVSGRYPWATHNAGLYQKAYRHFVTTCRKFANNIVYVWSPVGEKGLERYWPGDQYVDCVGVSVFEFPAVDQDFYHHPTRTFHDLMTEKYARVAPFQKPVVVSECGVTGSEEYQLSWLAGALEDMGNYPLLKGLIYFNAKETPDVWGKKYITPDWRISGLAHVIK